MAVLGLPHSYSVKSALSKVRAVGRRRLGWISAERPCDERVFDAARGEPEAGQLQCDIAARRADRRRGDAERPCQWGSRKRTRERTRERLR